MNIKHGDKGFHITTSTGYVLSVQYGAGNYCENYCGGNYSMKGEEVPEVSQVEIAIWRTDDPRMLELNGDTVAGHVPFSLIPHIIIDLEESKFDNVIRRLQFAQHN